MLLGALPAFVLLPPVPNKSWGHLRTCMSLLCLGLLAQPSPCRDHHGSSCLRAPWSHDDSSSDVLRHGDREGSCSPSL